MSPAENPYCRRAGIEPPRLEACVGRKKASLFHLMVVALLERGGPMRLEEIAARLEAAGVEARTGDMALSLQRAWHGLEPVWLGPEGRFHLDPDSRQMHRILLVTDLLPGPRPPEPAPPPTELPVRPDTEPLGWEEVERAFGGRRIGRVSPQRQAAAVLDARGPDLPMREVEFALSGLTRWRRRLTGQAARCWSRPMVRLEEGRLVLDRAREEDLRAMRRAIRDLARRAPLRPVDDDERPEALRAQEAAHRAHRRRFQRRAAETARRAILQVVPSPGEPRAAGLLDLADRSVRTFLGGGMAALGDALARFDLVAGLHLPDTLHALGLEPSRWRVVDLGPPQNTWRLNDDGDTLPISAELLMIASTGIRRPLGDPAEKARDLAEGREDRLARRLAADLESLAAYYRYGLLQGAVRLRWNYLDEMLRVDWGLPGDRLLADYLRASRDHARVLEIVTGPAPDWKEPWARARRVRVLAAGWGSARVVGPGGLELLNTAEIQAVRFAGEGWETIR